MIHPAVTCGSSSALNLRSGSMKQVMGIAKSGVRDLAFDLLFRARVTAPSRCLAGTLTIVTFHRVLTVEQALDYPLPGLVVTPEELDAHLKFLTTHFRCMSLVNALEEWDSPTASSGAPLLAVTFDDGQLDNFENALPVLDANKTKASFYVPSQVLEQTEPLWHDRMARAVFALRTSDASEARQLLAQVGLLSTDDDESASFEERSLDQTKMWPPDQRTTFMDRAFELARRLALARIERPSWDAFMSPAQLRELVRRGHEVGAHSHSHALLPELSDDELYREVSLSKELLERALAAPVETFCYPNGDTDARVQAAVSAAGYRAAVTTAWGSNRPNSGLFTLRRCDMHARHSRNRHGEFSATRLAFRMSGLHPGLRGKVRARA